MKLTPGTVLADRYRAEERLGRGGMGEVWRCTDLEHETPVAVKVVREGRLDAVTARMFRDEVLAMAHLRHPGIVSVYDLVRTTGDDLALVMELRPGEPLSRGGRRPFAALRPILLAILDALAHAHARGVLHLDIKPDNVLVADEGGRVRVSLLDFGIAQAWRSGPQMASQRDAVMGTVPYMAPEQLMPEAGGLGPWTDLYTFGAMTFHLLSGRRPFEGQEPAVRILSPPPRFAAARHGAPEAMSALLATLMNPMERGRPTHAADVIAALRAMPDGSSAGARGERRLGRGARREPGRPRGCGDLGTDRSGGRRRGPGRPGPRGGAAGGGGVRARNRRGPAGHTCEREGGARARARSVPRGHERRRRDRGRFTCGRQAGHREPEASERHALQPEDRRGRGERPTDERPASD